MHSGEMVVASRVSSTRSRAQIISTMYSGRKRRRVTRHSALMLSSLHHADSSASASPRDELPSSFEANDVLLEVVLSIAVLLEVVLSIAVLSEADGESKVKEALSKAEAIRLSDAGDTALPGLHSRAGGGGAGRRARARC